MTDLSHCTESPCIGGVLQLMAPLDIGPDAPELARRLLVAVDRCGDLGIEYAVSKAKWVGREVSREQASSVDCVQRLNGDMLVEIDTTRVVAVSYCTSPTHSGVCLFGAIGLLLTMSSSDRDGVDKWIALALDIPGSLPQIQIDRG